MLDLQARCDQVSVALPLSNFGIRDAVHLVRHRQHCLREELQVLDMYAQLAGVSDEQETLNTDEVAVIQQLKDLPTINRSYISFRVFRVFRGSTISNHGRHRTHG